MTDELRSDVDALLDEAERFLGADAAARVAVGELRSRFHEPLRLALVGRLKAGKSTVLNALVGERLAPTDASECTRLVTWYRAGTGYDVEAVGEDGSRRRLDARRGPRGLELPEDLRGVDHLEVRWPTAALRRHTLVDTPGLLSSTSGISARTGQMLRLDSSGPAEADAVVFLIRHLHRDDLGVLDALADRGAGRASPVSALAVLSRADEIGGGRLDAMEAASRIARRMAVDHRLQPLCAGVVPVAGLLAEASCSLTEDDAAALRLLAEDPEIDDLLLSVDRFRAAGRSGLDPATRDDLLRRIGLFGIRRCVAALLDGRSGSAVSLADLLRELSGIAELRAVLDEHFLPRARLLKAVAVLASLRDLAAVARVDPADAAVLHAAVERVESSSQALAELRLSHLVRSGIVALPEGEAAEVGRLTGGGSAAAQLGLADDAPVAEQRTRALDGIGRWRARAEAGALDPEATEVARVVARAYERLFVALA